MYVFKSILRARLFFVKERIFKLDLQSLIVELYASMYLNSINVKSNRNYELSDE